MFVALRAVRIYYADVLHHSIEVDHAVRGTPEHAGQAIVERFLIDRFLLKQLPTAAMQDVDAGHPEVYVLLDQRLDQILPKNVSKSINQYRRGISSFHKLLKLIPVQYEIPRLVGFQAVHNLAGEWLKAADGGASSPQFRTASCGAGHIDDQIRPAGRTDKVLSDG